MLDRDLLLIKTILETHLKRGCDISSDDIDESNKDKVKYNMYLLEDADLAYCDICWGAESTTLPSSARILRLTNKGHDLITMLKTDTVWDKLKTTFIDKSSSWTMDVVFKLATQAYNSTLGL